MHASLTEVRRVAAALDSLRTALERTRVVAGGALAAPAETDREWRAASALRAVAAALDDGLAQVTRDCDEIVTALRAAVTAYEAADDRAAARLTAVRRRR
jgi:hypothetical protein